MTKGLEITWDMLGIILVCSWTCGCVDVWMCLDSLPFVDVLWFTNVESMFIVWGVLSNPRSLEQSTWLGSLGSSYVDLIGCLWPTHAVVIGEQEIDVVLPVRISAASILILEGWFTDATSTGRTWSFGLVILLREASVPDMFDAESAELELPAKLEHSRLCPRPPLRC